MINLLQVIFYEGINQKKVTVYSNDLESRNNHNDITRCY